MVAAWEMVIFGFLGLLGVAGQTTISLLRKPTWLSEDSALDANWKRLAIYSGAAGLGFGLIALVITLLNDGHGQAVALAAVGGYLLFQSLFTDFRVRRVDRWIMRVAIAIAAVTGVLILSLYGTEIDWMLYIVFVIATASIGFLPGVGDSDARAFNFLVLATYPIAGTAGIQWAAILIIVVLFAYYIGYSISQKKFIIKGLFTKLSFPMVPIVILPVVAVVLFGKYLPVL